MLKMHGGKQHCTQVQQHPNSEEGEGDGEGARQKKALCVRWLVYQSDGVGLKHRGVLQHYNSQGVSSKHVHHPNM